MYYLKCLIFVIANLKWVLAVCFPSSTEIPLPISLTTTLSTTTINMTDSSIKGKSQGLLQSQTNGHCYRGECVNGKCICTHGWKGTYCDECSGRVLFTQDKGFIYDGPKNYSTSSDCSWLIKPKSSHNIIKLQVLEFSSECGWDYLYIFDGDSIYSPILASFNGIAVPKGKNSTQTNTNELPEVVATSGMAFLYFFSDVAYTMSGFNISYEIDSCPNNCTGHGDCIVPKNDNLYCKCDEDWYGLACENRLCNCPEEDVCIEVDGEKCQCSESIKGAKCRGEPVLGYWSEAVQNVTTIGHSSHSSIYIKPNMYVFGGLQFRDLSQQKPSISYYNTQTKAWGYHNINSTIPSERYGHTTVSTDNLVLLFGGREFASEKLSDELWEYDTSTITWNKISYNVDFSNAYNTSSLTLWGHSATMIKSNNKDVMIVMFGYHTYLEYSGFVYEYDVESKTWTRPLSYGYPINPSFGHTATWDPSTQLIYIHGGYSKLESNSKYGISNQLISYNPSTKAFNLLASSGVPRYLHASVLYDDIIYIYGGSTHNDTNESNGALCFSSSFLGYDLKCNRWLSLPSPGENVMLHARYGHSAVVAGNKMLVYGGYDGTILSNVISYHINNCNVFINENDCLNALLCQWSDGICSRNTDCENDDDLKICSSIKSCSKCLSVQSNCIFCNGECKAKSTCGESEIVNLNECPDKYSSYCGRFMNSLQCDSVEQCKWDGKDCVESKNDKSVVEHQLTCGSHIDCEECAKRSTCMWCANRNECVATNSYVIQYPYGECRKWTRDDCTIALGCKSHPTCGDCNNDPACGWCDDGSGTGTGICMEGGSKGAIDINSTATAYPQLTNACPSNSWFYTDCPPCQCNGHSICENVTDCVECTSNTAGDHCEECILGYYGDSRNGGVCDPCFCNNHGTDCNTSSGKCYCDTKGIIGDTCDKCDNSGKYFGDPVNNGTCFYSLLINYSFTFTLNPATDKYVKAINYDNQPKYSTDVDLTFDSKEYCNVRLTIYKEKVNMTTADKESPEEIELEYYTGIKTLRYEFSGEKYQFGREDIVSSIRIYVNNFTIPIKITVSLVQRNGNLLFLLLVLFSVFLILLLITAIVWKLKVVYDNYTRQRQHQEELELMAARPFSAVHLDCQDIIENQIYMGDDESYQLLSKDPIEPGAITEEICANDSARVVSVFLWLPCGDDSSENFDGSKSISSSKSGKPGRNCSLAIGSTLISSNSSSKPNLSHQHMHQSKQKSNKSVSDRLRVVFRKRSSSSAATIQSPASVDASNNHIQTPTNNPVPDNKTVGNSCNSINCNIENASSSSSSNDDYTSRQDECIGEVKVSGTNIIEAYDNPVMSNRV